MANTLKLFCNRAVGFIDWLDVAVTTMREVKRTKRNHGNNNPEKKLTSKKCKTVVARDKRAANPQEQEDQCCQTKAAKQTGCGADEEPRCKPTSYEREDTINEQGCQVRKRHEAEVNSEGLTDVEKRRNKKIGSDNPRSECRDD